MSRALVTGISGFTGKYLADELKSAGHEVFGTGLGCKTAENNYQADLRDLESVRNLVRMVRPELVAHLGGVAFVGHDDLSELYLTNIVGTRNLLQALSELDTVPKAVMLASSANIYGNIDNVPITEQSPVNPANDYAVSKLAMEKMSRLWEGKLPVFIVRPFNYTGVGQSSKFIIPKIVSHYVQGARQIRLGNLDVFREFNDVRIFAENYRKLIEIAPTGKIINVCSGAAYRLKDVLGMMNDIAGYEIETKIDPHFVRQNEVKRLQGSHELLCSLIGAPKEISLKSTLSWMFKEMRV